jgi:biopolymer transport protein ExbD
MSIATVSSNQPMGEINTTPLIDVMLVLLIMIIMTIPIATNSLEYDLPQGGDGEPNPVKNSLVVTANDRLTWNGRGVSDAQLGGLLVRVRSMRPEPEVQFEPHASASYDRTAKVLQIVKASRVSRFGFVGNERYRVFSRAD